MTTAELATALPEIVTEQVPGPKSKELLDRRDAAIPKALCGKTYPICIKQGSGAMFEDMDGNKFLDWVGGVGVLNIGYSHPEVIEAVKKQTEKYFHTIFNVYVHDGYVTLAERLNEIMPCKGDVKKTYFANSGAECDENAIKIAKAFTKRSGVICFTGAFHGRTNLTMALTAKKVYAVGMGLGSRITPYGTTLLTSIVTSAISCNQTLAIMLTSQLCGENNPEKSSFALDLENTVVVIAPMIPWSIAGAVPLAAIGAPNISIAVAFYLYLLPLWGLAVHLFR